MIRNLDDISRCLYSLIATADTHDEIYLAYDTANGKYLMRLYNRYFNAKHAAKGFGYVGVGCITFAEARLVQFQERIMRRLS